jgi:hypothetical protein
MILAGHHGLKALLAGDTRHMSMLTGDYLSFSLRKGLYDQIRYLNETGMEVVRVNYNKGQPFIVPANQLQNKGKRYYFKDAYVLGKGQVFVSPLDLNIERGAIEQPPKPMIRLGTPVFDSAGNKRGILLINYLGAKLIRDIDKAFQGSGDIMLLNADDHFLKGSQPRDEWGFMYEDGEDRTFVNRFPRVWEKMADTDKGIYTGDDGLFTYAKIYPVSLLEITKEVLSDLETPAAEVNARIEVGELPTIEADPLQIRQLMQNLIANALKFHKPGKPPTVTISSRLTTSPDIAPVSDRFGATAEIAVQDNGIGFQPRYAEQKEVLDAAA